MRLCLFRNLKNDIRLDIKEIKTNTNIAIKKIYSAPLSTPENTLIETDDDPMKNTTRNRIVENSDILANVIFSFIYIHLPSYLL
jgi:hypothetical protein